MTVDAPVLRLARLDEIDQLEALIALSSRVLQAPHYSPAQLEAAIGTVFGVDTQLIRDGSYFVLECDGEPVACGGWSARATLFGADARKSGADARLDPATDAARIRAFFVHPDRVRRGLGRRLLEACETAAREEGFRRFELGATLAGEPFYRAFGYRETRRAPTALANGEELLVIYMEKNARSGAT